MPRVLISVYDKSGLEEFGRGLVELGFELVASGGTAGILEEHGLPVTEVALVTQSPEMMGGRVKTLHPRIHAGILARRDDEGDVGSLDEYGIEPFDIVCVNLYPFQQVTQRKDTREEQAVEMIDIGGPAMLRAAAKNFQHVRARLRARPVRLRGGRAAPRRHALRGDPPLARRRGVRLHLCPTRPPSPPGSRTARRSPRP